jgi:hypothetical protein
MTTEQILALVARNQQLEQAVKATPAAPTTPWYGGFKLFGKGTLVKGYQGSPDHPSEKGYGTFFSTKGVHPDSLKALPKSPSGILALAMLLADAAEALIDNAGQFVFSDDIQANWKDVLERFGPQ